MRFWYEFGSTYSYLTAMRIEGLAAKQGVEVIWKPFLLGPIFAKRGWNTSPFNLFPERGQYMWRDMERWAESLGIPLVMPDPFPQNSLRAARMALIGMDQGWVAPFSRAVFHAAFGKGEDISKMDVLTGILDELNIQKNDVLDAIKDVSLKDRLRKQTEEAETLGIFGAPSLVTSDGELFWGNDRLEEALHWETAGALPFRL